MAQRGRKPKPTKLKVLQGNPGKRPLNENELNIEPSVPECPKHLDKDAKKEWKRVIKILEPLNMLTRIDYAMLGAYCQLYSDWVKVEKEKQQPEFKPLMLKVTVDGAGNEHVTATENPLLKSQRAILKEIRVFCSLFGMSPSDRARLQVPTSKPKNPFEEF